MKRLTKTQKKWLIPLLLTLLIGAALIVSLSIYFQNGGSLPFEGLLSQQMQSLLAILLLAIPAVLVLLAGAGSLVFLICAFIKDKKEAEKNGRT